MAEEPGVLGGKLVIAGKTYGIYGGVNTIGRNKIGVVNLKNLGVSQYHAIIILVDDDMHFISDLKSSNGTFVNGTKLNPLHLYMIENGDSIKFANLEGVYTKCYNESQMSITSNSQNTQSCTQSFYGSDTQIIDVSKTQLNSKKTHYISTQVLVQAAIALESSYEKLHEQPTQLLGPSRNLDSEPYLVEKPNIDQSVFDLHEAETQKINICETDIHEVETQVVSIVPIDQESSNASEVIKALTVDETYLYNNPPVNDNIASSVLNRGSLENDSIQANANTRTSSQSSSNGVNLTQESDAVCPVGIVRNVVSDSQSTIAGSDDNDVDIIRPVKKSVNLFTSQESIGENDNGDDIVRPVQKSVNPFLSQESVKENAGEIIKHLENSDNAFLPQDKINDSDNKNETLGDDDESSNDSLDFMTMQKVTDTENKNLDTNYDENLVTTKSIKKHAVVEKSQKVTSDDDDTDVESDTKKNSAHEDGSETDNENSCAKGNINIDKEKQKMSDSDTDIENGRNNSSNSETKLYNKAKKYSKKKKNTILDSDSDTDIEDANKISSLKQTACPASHLGDIDTNSLDKELTVDDKAVTNLKNSGAHILVNSSINISIGDESMFGRDSLVIDESVIESAAENTDNENLKECKEIPHSPEKILDESDIIPCTQEVFEAKSSSQNSKLDNSESFKLGLTQLMEEDGEENSSKKQNSENEPNEEQKEENSSDTSQQSSKKFVFKKKPGNIKEANVTLDFREDDEIYLAATQKLHEKSSDVIDVDDNIFLHPSQATIKRRSNNKNNPEEDIYAVATQKFVEAADKSAIEDIYMEPTQKLIIHDVVDPGEGTSKGPVSDDIYQQATQKLIETDNHDALKTPGHPGIDDLNDMFASQITSPNTVKNKKLESELEDMFATQRFTSTEESLDKIKDVLFQKPLVDTKLPEEDSDLEAILQTQKILDSPKTTKPVNKTVHVGMPAGRSVESQLEVIFTSQVANLPPDKFERPSNPLVGVFEKETETEKGDTDIPKVAEVEITAEKSFETSNSSMSKHNTSEFNTTKSAKSFQSSLEQSFALLEAKSTKCKRTSRNTTCEDIKVSCTKSSRASMSFTPNKHINTTVQQVQPVEGTNKRTIRKRQNSVSSENSNPEAASSKKNSITIKKRRTSRSSCNSDDDADQNLPSTSSRSTRSSRTSKKLQIIGESDDEDFEISYKPTETNLKKTSTRTNQKNTKLAEEDVNEGQNEVKPTRTSRRTKVSPVKLSDYVSKEELMNNNAKNLSKTTINPKTVEKVSVGNDKKELKTPVKSIAKNKKSHSKIDDTFSETKSDISEVSNKTCESDNKKRRGRTKSSGSNLDTNITDPSTSADLTGSGSSRKTKSAAITESTPPKMKKVSIRATPSSSARSDQCTDSPSRSKRKLKPKVVFTMMDSPALESSIRQLGGSVVSSVDTCTVLITQSVKRSMKLLAAIGLGKPICSDKWIEDSRKQKEFLDPWDYILVDREAEEKWDFSLSVSLERSRQEKLFEGYMFQLLVSNALDVLKGAIESCGGKIVNRIPKEADNFIVIASAENKAKCTKLLKQNPNLIIVEPEAIFDGVLRQEIRFERHFIK